MKITFPDGQERAYNPGVTGLEIAAQISPSLAKAAVAMLVNGQLRDLDEKLVADSSLVFLTTKDTQGLDVMRHTTTAQGLARAVKELFPQAKLAIGPTIDHGFYYDIELDQSLSSDDLPKIEEAMRRIIAENNPVTRELWPAEAVKDYFAKRGETYKVEIVSDAIAKGQLLPGDQLSIYRQSVKNGEDFIDLCRGPHTRATGQISSSFRLTHLAGAYWRGDSKNKMLTRIYGLSFINDQALKAHIAMLEEAAKRDHRKLGKELELFTIVPDAIGSGLPLWLPKGTIIRDELEKWAKEEENKDGYVRVATPVLTKESLYYCSGHLPYYKEDMYSPMEIDGERYYLRPMNCPHHHHVYLSKPRSYRDLPLRIAEYGSVYRYEAHGGLSGLMRTRGFCQNDGHLYCREDQAEEEFIKVMKLHARYYETLGIKEFYMRLSKPDLGKLEKYVDAPEKWLKALAIIESAMKKSGLPYIEAEGEAAFYGPKVDFQIKSVVGTEYTISTNQLDFLATERFGLTYRGADGKDHPVYVIHRAPLGSHERFVAFLIEHFGGHFPLWLAPVQIIVTGIAEKHNEAVVQLVQKLREEGFRVEADESSEKINYKVRQYSLQKVPVILVLGDQEIANQTATIRRLGSPKQTTLPVSELIAQLGEEVRTKQLPAFHSNDL
ncbi:MAG: threonine--tRNA ligase [Verrucomicrobia bacterium]|nr:threonine--tRNA ligase [Verrucomicrobiota bacterium]